MKRILITILLLLAIAATGLFGARDRLLQQAVIRPLTNALQADVEIGSVESDFRGRHLVLHDVRIHNPAGFSDQVAVEIRRLQVRYTWAGLFGRVQRLSEVVIDMRKVRVETDAAGRTNMAGMVKPSADSSPPPAAAAAEIQRAPAATAPPSAPSAKSARRTVKIDQLTVRLDEVEWKQRESARPRQYRLNWERTFENVEGFESIGQAMALDLGLVMAPAILQETWREVKLPPEITAENMEAVGRQLDAETKDLQRELRQQFRELRRQAAP